MSFLCRFRHKWKDTGARTTFEKDPIFMCERCGQGKYVSRSGLNVPIPAAQLALYLSIRKAGK